MLAGCLTKDMDATFLRQVLQLGRFRIFDSEKGFQNNPHKKVATPWIPLIKCCHRLNMRENLKMPTCWMRSQDRDLRPRLFVGRCPKTCLKAFCSKCWLGSSPGAIWAVTCMTLAAPSGETLLARVFQLGCRTTLAQGQVRRKSSEAAAW